MDMNMTKMLTMATRIVMAMVTSMAPLRAIAIANVVIDIMTLTAYGA